jgi:hypothetical protein
MCLSAVYTTEGTQLEQATCNGSTLQQWEVTAEGSGYYLINEDTGYVADVNGGSKTAGAAVIDYAKNGGTNQQWKFSSDGQGYYNIVNVNSGMCLDVVSASTSSGADIDQYNCNGGTNHSRNNSRAKWGARGSDIRAYGLLNRPASANSSKKAD